MDHTDTEPTGGAPDRPSSSAGPSGVAVPVAITRPGAITRRSMVLGAAGFLPLLRLLPESTVRAAFAQAPDGFRFFDEHQAAVVTEATARLIPGPDDDPAEAGHPGAREAGVVHYIDLLLSAFDDDPPHIYATGPWSSRGGGEDEMDGWIPLAPWQDQMWRTRIGALQDRYRAGIAELDSLAGGDFTSAGKDRQDEILIGIGGAADGFRRILFEHAVEGMYAAPEYGGNRGLVGWTGIDYAGDQAPKGYPPDALVGVVEDPAPPGVALPFPPDMATAGTADPLGGSTLPVRPASYRPGEVNQPGSAQVDRAADAADVDGLVTDPDAFFTAAEPGIARLGPYSRGRRNRGGAR